MGKPAARIGDEHICPKVTPGTPPVPHVGGPVFGDFRAVLIEGLPAARVGDSCTCIGETDFITRGSWGVFIGGLPAARMGDQTAHGGKIVAGSKSVMIGEKKIPRILKKVGVINDAIEISIVLLENKLQLLERNDPDTLIAFKEWFGQDDDTAKGIIKERISEILKVCSKLTVERFSIINSKKEKDELYACSHLNDCDCKIYLGNKFWEKEGFYEKAKAGVIIHELSHFCEIGKTEDVIYGSERCLNLAKSYPSFALINAESFEYFVLS
ncbi:hypothetical protein A4D02_05005 [Niastella koreensis]|uniref:PAAR repeat-containing protein n=2 Tax=Niastella koreensis TaxID=354356 RepID=G8T7T7_NIAKG|nr:M35 family metallo-endopeptidase [Niastella koreensis]AEW03381.1 PAAR repeat-containing protein [Niastella koreensis GR20-10]OQP55662.1 hypothetical protein A4D02_05005 [Niastella koreensis]